MKRKRLVWSGCERMRKLRRIVAEMKGEKGKAKPYQVKQVKLALERLIEFQKEGTA